MDNVSAPIESVKQYISVFSSLESDSSSYKNIKSIALGALGAIIQADSPFNLTSVFSDAYKIDTATELLVEYLTANKSALKPLSEENVSNIMAAYTNFSNQQHEDDPPEYVDEEIVETLSTAFDLARKVLPTNAAEIEVINTPIPKLLTLDRVYNLIILLLTLLTIYLSEKPNEQLETLIELQEQEIEILQESNESYQTALSELNESLVRLSDQLELIYDNSPDDSDNIYD